MRSHYKNENTLKSLHFYSEEIKSVKKKKKNSNSKFFTKKPKEITIKQLSHVLPFPPKKPKTTKRLTK